MKNAGSFHRFLLTFTRPGKPQFVIPSLLHLGCLHPGVNPEFFPQRSWLYQVIPGLVNVNKKRWKDPAFFMGKLTTNG